MKLDGALVARQSSLAASSPVEDDLLERARAAGACHWDEHRRPISAKTQRRMLRIGAVGSRLLVTVIWAESQERSAQADMLTHAGE